MTRCILIEETHLDTSSVDSYGDKVYLFGRAEARPSIWDDAFRESVLQKLDDLQYDPDNDYFVVSGAIVTLNIVSALLGAHYGVFQTLCFSTTERRYVPVIMGERFDDEGPTTDSDGTNRNDVPGVATDANRVAASAAS